jgi:acetyl-CoA carboxylase beta subunit
MLTDEGSFDEYAEDLVSSDPLEFDDTKPYKARLRSAAGTTGLRDAFVAGKAKLGGLPYHLGVFEFKFMGGSMGVVVGESHASTKMLSRIVCPRSWFQPRAALGCRKGFFRSCKWRRLPA